MRCAGWSRSAPIEAAFLDAVAAGEFEHVPLTTADISRTAELVRAYADLPLGAVDASVIAIAERLKLTDVATLDRREGTDSGVRRACELVAAGVAGFFPWLPA